MINEDMSAGMIIDIINLIYKKYGFQAVIDEVEYRLKYGSVKKINDLVRISTGGWSDEK